jgi:hypothetical protein
MLPSRHVTACPNRLAVAKGVVELNGSLTGFNFEPRVHRGNVYLLEGGPLALANPLFGFELQIFHATDLREEWQRSTQRQGQAQPKAMHQARAQVIAKRFQVTAQHLQRGI